MTGICCSYMWQILAPFICSFVLKWKEEISLMWFCPLFVNNEDGIFSLSPPAVTFWWNLCFCTVPDGSKVKRANKEPRRAKAPPQGPLGEATSPQCKVTLRPAGLTDGLHRCHQMYFSLLLRCASFHATEQDTGGKPVVSMLLVDWSCCTLYSHKAISFFFCLVKNYASWTCNF